MALLAAIAEQIDRSAPLRLTLLLLLLRPPDDDLLRGLTWLLAGVALVVPRLSLSPALWLALTATVVARLVVAWPLADNHIYLLAYWCLGITLALRTTDAVETLSRTSRWLVAATFACAVLWKALAAPDFLDARFFRVTLATDDRFACVAEAIGGLSPTQRVHNQEALAPLPEGAELLNPPTVIEPPALRALALGLTWGGLALEALVALAFALPGRWARGCRHPALLLFIVGTYAIAPVAGFGWLLAAMGLSHADSGHPRLPLAYLAAFAAVLVYAETPLMPYVLRCSAP